LYRATDSLSRRGAPVKNLAHSASLDSGEENAPSKSGIKHLGDTIEASGFAVSHAGRTFTFELDESHVFEDRRVRLVELDDDPSPECFIIRASLTGGAAIAVYDIGPNGITPKAETPDIGKPNRWLNIAGFGDFTGRGEIEIAAVVTPHIAGSLRV
jgi:hypothetical protein